MKHCSYIELPGVALLPSEITTIKSRNVPSCLYDPKWLFLLFYSENNYLDLLHIYHFILLLVLFSHCCLSSIFFYE